MWGRAFSPVRLVLRSGRNGPHTWRLQAFRGCTLDPGTRSLARCYAVQREALTNQANCCVLWPQTPYSEMNRPFNEFCQPASYAVSKQLAWGSFHRECILPTGKAYEVRGPEAALDALHRQCTLIWIPPAGSAQTPWSIKPRGDLYLGFESTVWAECIRQTPQTPHGGASQDGGLLFQAGTAGHLIAHNL